MSDESHRNHASTVKFWPDELPPGFEKGGRGLVVPHERVEEMRRSIEHEQAARMALELAVAEANKFAQLAVMERMAAFEQILRPLGIDLRDSEGINYDPETKSIFKLAVPPQPQQITPEAAAAGALRARMAQQQHGRVSTHPGSLPGLGGHSGPQRHPVIEGEWSEERRGQEGRQRAPRGPGEAAE